MAVHSRSTCQRRWSTSASSGRCQVRRVRAWYRPRALTARSSEDHQEVFACADTDQSVIVEIVDRSEVADSDCAKSALSLYRLPTAFPDASSSGTTSRTWLKSTQRSRRTLPTRVTSRPVKGIRPRTLSGIRPLQSSRMRRRPRTKSRWPATLFANQHFLNVRR